MQQVINRVNQSAQFQNGQDAFSFKARAPEVRRQHEVAGRSFSAFKMLSQSI